MKALESCFYRGTIRHRRFTPADNHFTYPACMAYINIDKLETLFTGRWFFALNKKALVSFNTGDYLPDKQFSLRQYIDGILAKEKIPKPKTIMLLTHLKFFGFGINPISCYYCFNDNDKLIAIVAAVTNTPWQETIHYVLSCDPNQKNQRINFNKLMHVSPFNYMDMNYQWRNNLPEQTLAIHINCINQDSKKIMDATLTMKRVAWNTKSKWSVFLSKPLNTWIVAYRIYWQALKLWLKNVPFVPSPIK